MRNSTDGPTGNIPDTTKREPKFSTELGLESDSRLNPSLRLLGLPQQTKLRIGLAYIEGCTQQGSIINYLSQFGSVELLTDMGNIPKELELLVVASDENPGPNRFDFLCTNTYCNSSMVLWQNSGVLEECIEKGLPTLFMGQAAYIIGEFTKTEFGIMPDHKDKMTKLIVGEAWVKKLNLDRSEFYGYCNHTVTPLDSGNGFSVVAYSKDGCMEHLIHVQHKLLVTTMSPWNVIHKPHSKIHKLYNYLRGDVITNEMIKYLTSLKT